MPKDVFLKKIPHLHESMVVSAWLALVERRQTEGLTGQDAKAFEDLLTWISGLKRRFQERGWRAADMPLLNSQVVLGDGKKVKQVDLSRQRVGGIAEQFSAVQKLDKDRGETLVAEARDCVEVLVKAGVSQVEEFGDLVEIENAVAKLAVSKV